MNEIILRIILIIFAGVIGGLLGGLFTHITIQFIEKIKNKHKNFETVYIVINDALHHDASYHEIVDIFRNHKDALTCIQSEYEDMHNAINKGDFGDDFDNILIEENKINSIIDTNMYIDYIVSDEGYYEAWKIEEFVIN